MKKLHAEQRVTREVRRAAHDAMEDYQNYTTFEHATMGGYDEQPAEWVEAITCIKAASEEARHTIEAEIEADQKRAQASKSKKRR
jgi:hypothetical protein